MTQDVTATKPIRQFIPLIGTRVRVNTLEQELALTGEYNWHVYIAKSISLDSPYQRVVCELTSAANASRNGELISIPLAMLSRPIGWQERYTIHVSPDKVSEVVSWLPRGIAVRMSQYIGDHSTSFQPLDNSPTPHWKYTELTDTIPPELTRDCISIVSVESHFDAFIPCQCTYCNGTGIHTSNPSLVQQTIAHTPCDQCGTHMGFSFSEPWHDSNTHIFGASCCSTILPPGYCWVCNGTGIGTRYLSSMEPRKERKSTIAQLERDGWRIWYQRHQNVWRMEREVVIKEFGEDYES